MSGSPERKRQRTTQDSFQLPDVEMTEATADLSLDSKALNKFSRQNAALGAETTAKLIKMKIVVFGLRGVGVETCKNLTLQGIGGITIIDPEPVSRKDLGVNFFFSEEDVGKNRAEVVLPRLRELNPVCALSIGTSLTDLDLRHFNGVVVTQILDVHTLLQLNERCRRSGVSFFYCFTGGLATDIFVDHGPEHTVFDATGEKPMQKLVTSIQRVSDNELQIRYDTPEGQQAVAIDKGVYEITEVSGMSGLNHHAFPVLVSPSDPVKSLRIAYPLSAGTDDSYQGGGLLTEKKVTTAHPMASLAEKLVQLGDPWADPPTTVQTDYFGSELQQHVAFYAVHVFFGQHRRLPAVRSSEDLAAVAEIAKLLVESKAVEVGEGWERNEDYFRNYVSLCGVELQALSAFAGGVVAQEVVKSTGKFTPIPGFLHFSSFESLPGEGQVPTAEDSQARNDPRDELAAVYGWSFVEKLGNLQYFLVGSGALGCEFLKNFALNNVCCGPAGKLTVTDADRIELSNLARQFLFREHNVGQPKSKAAAAMAKTMNDGLNVEALEVFVGPKTEDVFHDDFWMSLDGVCNALDNIEARLYVDKQCVRYERPLLESGTMGTNGNVDTIVPFKTRTYGEGGQAAEGMGVPMCTLRNFPHLPDHCIEWSRDLFELLFVKLGKQLEAFLADPASFVQKAHDKAHSEAGASFFDLRALTSYARLASAPSVGTAVQCAFDLFHFLFRDRILDLQTAFPKDFRIVDDKTGQDKGPFWNEKKRYPTVITFDPSNATHVDFLRASTILLGVTVGLFPNKTDDIAEENYLRDFRSRENSDWLLHIAQGVAVPPYVSAPVSADGGGDESLKSTVEQQRASQEAELQQKLSGLVTELEAAAQGVRGRLSGSARFASEPLAFEKDDDANEHVAFVTSAANLRCFNYAIRAVDFHEVKVIAGKIIAAIATTTAAVCGLVMLELFKVLLGKDTDAYMNRNLGLGGNKFTSFSAESPVKFRTKTETVAPDISAGGLPEEAFDEKGAVKKEFYETVVHRAHPEMHSVWDKLTVSADLDIASFARWLETEHGLKLETWNFIYGYRTVADADGGAKETVGVTAKVYPPSPVLDETLLPALDLTLNQATQTLMKNPQTRPQLQAYLARWKAKVAEVAGTGSSAAAGPVVTASTTLREVLQQMSVLGAAGVNSGALDSQTISNLAQRRFVLLPGKETPSVVWSETGEAVEFLAALKIVL